MGNIAITTVFVTTIFGIVGGVLPFVVQKGPNMKLTQCLLVLIGSLCWLFWLCCYMAQLNPLIGPRLNNHTIYIMAREWNNKPLD